MILINLDTYPERINTKTYIDVEDNTADVQNKNKDIRILSKLI